MINKNKKILSTFAESIFFCKGVAKNMPPQIYDVDLNPQKVGSDSEPS